MIRIKYFLVSIFFICFYFNLFSNIIKYNFDIELLSKRLKINVLINLSRCEQENVFLFSKYADLKNLKVNEENVNYKHINDSLIIYYGCTENAWLDIEYELPIDSFMIAEDAIILRRENRWYPVIYNQLFECELNIKVQDNFYIIASGNKEYSKGKLKFYCPSIQTIPLIILEKNSYKKIVFGKNQEINFYSAFEDSTNKNDFLVLIEKAFSFYQKFFGYRPFDSVLEVVEIPNRDIVLSQSLPNVIIYGRQFYDWFLEDYFDWISHEVCHQWWGLNLFFDYYAKNYWLIAESVNEYLNMLCVKEICGNDVLNKLIDDKINILNEFITDDNDIPIIEIEDVFSQNTGMLMYQKAPLIIFCLAKYFGEKDFNERLKKFFLTNRKKIVTYNDFYNFILLSSSEKNVKYFDELINHKGIIYIKNILNESE